MILYTQLMILYTKRMILCTKLMIKSLALALEDFLATDLDAQQFGCVDLPCLLVDLVASFHGSQQYARMNAVFCCRFYKGLRFLDVDTGVVVVDRLS